MSYSMYTYALPGVVVPLFLASILIILASLISRFLMKRGYGIAALTPFVLTLAIFLYALFGLSDGYRYPVCATLQFNGDRYITTGYVENVVTVPAPPMYYDSSNDRWSQGKLVAINEHSYFIPFGEINPGDAVELVWGSDERVVFDFTVLGFVPDKEIGTRLVSNAADTNSGSSLKEVASLILRISLGCLVGIVILWRILGKRLSDHLVNKDKETILMIKPHITGAVLLLIQSTPIAGIATGMVIAGFKGALWVFLMVACVWMVIIIKKLSTRVEFGETSITIIQGRSKTSFDRKNIKQVYFSAPRLHYPRSLVIHFGNSCVRVFNQTDFWGLSYAHQELSKGPDDGAQGQGDGSAGQG